MKKKLISIVASAYNEEGNIKILYSRIKNVMEKSSFSFELVLIDNNSSDKTYKILKSLNNKDKRVKCLSLSKTFGHQEALLAGIDHSKGDAVITMDSDLQHPPEIISNMLKLWVNGNKIVYTTKKIDYNIPFFRYNLTKLYYFIISKISVLKLSFGQSDFRLLDRQVVNILCKMKERPKFLRGLVDWVGFNNAGIEYSVQKRHSGESKYTFTKLLGYGLNGIFSFSMVPLRIFLVSGLIISTLCICYAIFNILLKILSVYFKSIIILPGWTTITIAILFFGSIQLIGIGLLGEYIGRIYEQVKERPEYIVKEKNI